VALGEDNGCGRRSMTVNGSGRSRKIDPVKENRTGGGFCRIGYKKATGVRVNYIL